MNTFCIWKKRQILVQLDLKEKIVLSDRKSLCFMLSQLIANSIKYTGCEAEKCPKLKISSGSENNRVCLSVCDNGCGVKPYELRYLFEKGFTGENSQKKLDRDGIISGTADRTGIKDRSRSSVSLRKRNGNQTLVSVV